MKEHALMKFSTLAAVLAALLLPACAGLQPSGFQSPGTAGAPATASNLAQTVGNDQASVPGTATGGTGSGNIYNQFASQVPSEVALEMLKVAQEMKWSADQTIAAFKALSGAPTNVTLSGAQTNTVEGGAADNAGAGSGGSGSLTGGTMSR